MLGSDPQILQGNVVAEVLVDIERAPLKVCVGDGHANTATVRVAPSKAWRRSADPSFLKRGRGWLACPGEAGEEVVSDKISLRIAHKGRRRDRDDCSNVGIILDGQRRE